ncbi:hypothetical protein T484DRAFT_1875250 [Baffinella frigidus]|nr:hypothetical protein T484DRAFT_1875250 [Cryptophyta sp. CCMP2293]
MPAKKTAAKKPVAKKATAVKAASAKKVAPPKKSLRRRDSQGTMAAHDASNDIEYPALLGTMERQEGKVFVITGSTTGVGYHAARACASKGATVVMLNRASPRVAAAVAAISAEVTAEARDGRGVAAKLVAIECDLMSFASVRQAAAAVTAQFPAGIDVVCLNAGIGPSDEEATEDGFDHTMQVNHLGHFLLTKELLPLLEKAAQGKGDARIVSVSSFVRYIWPFHAEAANAVYYRKLGEAGSLGGNSMGLMCRGGPFQRYHQSKLANMLFTSALDEKLRASGSRVKALVAAPGFAITPIFGKVDIKTLGGNTADTMFNIFARTYAQSAADGAVPILTCMVLPSAISGQSYEPADWGPGWRFKVSGPAKV